MIYFLITSILILIDQLSKYFAQTYLVKGESIVIIPKVISFTYVENTGAAYGMFSDSTKWLSFLSLIISVIIVYVMINHKKYFEFKYVNYILAVTLAGAIGNGIDRFLRHYVVDFIRFDFVDFPVFNIADICVVVSSICLIICVILFEDDGKGVRRWKN